MSAVAITIMVAPLKKEVTQACSAQHSVLASKIQTHAEKVVSVCFEVAEIV